MDRDDAKLGIARGDHFQTKSLYAAGSKFTITEDGRLVEHLCRFEPDAIPTDYSSPILAKRVEVGDTAIDYHGDVLLTGYQSATRCVEFVARFTHGRLECTLSLDEYPEENLTILVEQGAR